ncbi:transposase [Actinoplanes sp. N902-109]|uniref:transposase n=1 Tax=Actinoplanes sp. (strain N902-109) TaxID=649831 RepID=UPI0018DB407E|nr:transposase [Actinoplanes sp. N902-109]
MRLTTAVNRIIRLTGATVQSAAFTDQGLVIAFRNLVRWIEKHAEAIVAAVGLGLSNSRLEGINAKIRLIQRRGFGYRNLDALTAANRAEFAR